METKYMGSVQAVLQLSLGFLRESHDIYIWEWAYQIIRQKE